jgi:hypothetical protein
MSIARGPKETTLGPRRTTNVARTSGSNAKHLRPDSTVSRGPKETTLEPRKKFGSGNSMGLGPRRSMDIARTFGNGRDHIPPSLVALTRQRWNPEIGPRLDGVGAPVEH